MKIENIEDFDHIVCKQEPLLREMHGDVKTLIIQNDTIKSNFDKYVEKLEGHVQESSQYRKKVDSLWTGVHLIKWVLGLLLGAGILWKIIYMFTR